MLKRLERVLLAAFFAGLLSQAAFAVTIYNSQCRDRLFSACSDYGEWYCEDVASGCSGSCYNCTGPGAMPNKVCVDYPYTTCTANFLECGERRDGTCSDPGWFGDCYCEDGGAASGPCTFLNCG